MEDQINQTGADTTVETASKSAIQDAKPQKKGVSLPLVGLLVLITAVLFTVIGVVATQFLQNPKQVNPTVGPSIATTLKPTQTTGATAAPSVPPAISEIPANWKSYQNANFKVSLKYPPEWVVNAQSGADVMYLETPAIGDCTASSIVGIRQGEAYFSLKDLNDYPGFVAEPTKDQNLSVNGKNVLFKFYYAAEGAPAEPQNGGPAVWWENTWTDRVADVDNLRYVTLSTGTEQFINKQTGVMTKNCETSAADEQNAVTVISTIRFN